VGWCRGPAGEGCPMPVRHPVYALCVGAARMIPMIPGMIPVENAALRPRLISGILRA
jgi:hypothetical protein